MQIIIDGINFNAPDGWTILEAAKFLGIKIPTLCYHNGLSPWGGCRLCIVEIGKDDKTKLVSSCIYPVEEGLKVTTYNERIVSARKMILELLISQCPTSKVLQDFASDMGLNRIRFKSKGEMCIYCGLCVRMCTEQMMANAIGFAGRGKELSIDTPFSENSEDCRKCGACIYVCPACTLRCDGPEPENLLCGGCVNHESLDCMKITEN